jgi:hypothetical protein
VAKILESIDNIGKAGETAHGASETLAAKPVTVITKPFDGGTLLPDTLSAIKTSVNGTDPDTIFLTPNTHKQKIYKSK